jgi:hypothetical protein
MFYRHGISKYNRKPDIILGDLTSNRIQKYRSANGKNRIVLSHFQEPLNNVVISFFCLTTRFGKILEKFEYLISFSIPKLIQWSPDSNCFSIPLYNFNGIGIYNLSTKKICFIPVAEIFNIEIQLDNHQIHFHFDDSYAVNFEKSDLYPVKTVKIPEAVIIDFESLIWFDVKDYNSMFQLSKTQAKINFHLEYLQFEEYKGEFPITTDIEIYKIVRFAEYGHKQSIEWLNELNLISGGKFYHWEMLSKYIKD